MQSKHCYMNGPAQMMKVNVKIEALKSRSKRQVKEVLKHEFVIEELNRLCLYQLAKHQATPLLHAKNSTLKQCWKS